jgi:hypothetical protein
MTINLQICKAFAHAWRFMRRFLTDAYIRLLTSCKAAVGEVLTRAEVPHNIQD